MNILLLGEKAALLRPFLEKTDHFTLHTNDKIELEDTIVTDFIISFGYKHIINDEIIEVFGRKMINLHISYLPFNRGADPNLWSFLENTRKGVTIHRISKELDSGDILYQKTVSFSDSDTLKTSYDKLINEIIVLFVKNMKNIFENDVTPLKQTGKSTYHTKADKNKYLHLITAKGYDTPVSDLKGKALKK